MGRGREPSDEQYGWNLGYFIPPKEALGAMAAQVYAEQQFIYANVFLARKRVGCRAPEIAIVVSQSQS
ncbi:hypothetical protein PSUB009319_43880 [Ralstonia sp. SET104]|nr:hypothetical protein PSUB009319_43880 [Ralstonia sp. SET104]